MQQLLIRNAKVYMAARNEQKALLAIEELKAETGQEAIWLPLDLASLKTVKAAAEEFMRFVLRFSRVHLGITSYVTAKKQSFISCTTTRRSLADIAKCTINIDVPVVSWFLQLTRSQRMATTSNLEPTCSATFISPHCSFQSYWQHLHPKRNLGWSLHLPFFISRDIASWAPD